MLRLAEEAAKKAPETETARLAAAAAGRVRSRAEHLLEEQVRWYSQHRGPSSKLRFAAIQLRATTCSRTQPGTAHRTRPWAMHQEATDQSVSGAVRLNSWQMARSKRKAAVTPCTTESLNAKALSTIRQLHVYGMSASTSSTKS
jgi:hypothetical protein